MALELDGDNTPVLILVFVFQRQHRGVGKG